MVAYVGSCTPSIVLDGSWYFLSPSLAALSRYIDSAATFSWESAMIVPPALGPVSCDLVYRSRSVCQLVMHYKKLSGLSQMVKYSLRHTNYSVVESNHTYGLNMA